LFETAIIALNIRPVEKALTKDKIKEKIYKLIFILYITLTAIKDNIKNKKK